MRASVGLPAVAIEVDGTALSDAVLASLEEVRVSRRLSRPAQCLLCLHLGPDPPSAVALLRPGSRLRLSAGVGPSSVFSGEVTGCETVYGADGSRRLRVRAYDVLHRLRQGHAGRTFVEVSVRELAEELLAGEAPVVGAEGPRRSVVVGAAATDLELLARHAHRAGLYLIDDNGSVRITSLEGHGEPMPLRLGDDLHEVAVDHDGHRAVSEVRAVAWRPDDASVLRASSPAAGDGGSTGSERPRDLLDVASCDGTELDAIAEGEAARRVAGRRVVRAVVEGRPGLVPGRRITLPDVPESAGTAFTITEAVLTIDRLGFLVRLTSEPPDPLPPPAATTVTLGEVVEIDDPEGRGRVRVRLPMAADALTPWAPVVVPGAGAGRGLVALPDVGDPVAVSLLDGDPARAVVLGGLYGLSAPSDAGVAGGRRKRFAFATASGASLVLDDDGDRVQLEHPNGSSIELSSDAFHLRSSVPLTIDSAGQRVTIRARAVNFEEV